MAPGIASLILILAAGAAVTLLALSLRLSPKTRPFAGALAVLAMAATGAALSVSAMIDDPPRWSRQAPGLLLLVLPTLLAATRLIKLWRAMTRRATA